MKQSTKDKVKKITEQLEAGVQELFSSDRYAAYLTIMSKFHRYSVNNCLLIHLQRPEATYVAGFKKWNEMGRHVKKGEKAITILAPIQRKYVVETENDDGEKIAEEHKYMAFMPASVFDISQTEGEELPTIMTALTGEAEAGLLEKIISISPVPVRFEEISGDVKGYYNRTGYIAIKTGMSGVQSVKTLLHEIAHAILHSKEGAEKDADRNTKEVQAESTAFTVSKYLGLDTSDYSFGYIAGWSSGKSADELRNSLEVIRGTANDIISRLEAVCP